jgi:sugar phosphate isomerase/epimerase
MVKIGVFTVMLPDLTPEAAAPALRDAGYEGVEWRITTIPPERRSEPPSFWGNNLCTLEPTLTEAKRARDLAAAHGLEIPGLGTYIGTGDLSLTETAMQVAQACGAKQIRVGVPGMRPGVSYHDLFDQSVGFLQGVEDLARTYGIKGLVETHHHTITCSASLTHRLVSRFDPARIGVIHDAGNMAHEGFENYRLGVELLGPYLAHVHVKNVRYRQPEAGGVWVGEWSPLEDGLINFDVLFTALKETGYDGWIVVEDFSSARPTRPALRHNIDFLKEKLTSIYS